MGGIIAKRLSLNRIEGPIFGGIYASRLAAHFNIPIRHYEKEEKMMPRVYLDYKSMVAHDFLLRIGKKSLNINCSLINIILRLLSCLLLLCLIL